MSGEPKCRWCQQRHPVNLLCASAKQILDALYAKGMEGNMPTIEFDTPILHEGLLGKLGLNPGDRLLSQLVIKAANVPIGGAQFPAVIFTGRDPAGDVLPNWLYAGDEAAMTALVQLVTDTTAMAVRAADKANA